MPRGYVRWLPASLDVPGLPEARSADLRKRLVLADTEPIAVAPLRPRDEAVFLLHTAAEVEHALLVQYLYARYSMGDPYARVSPDDLTSVQADVVAGWQGTLNRIAKQEMGHLVCVQNILHALGGPLNFEREDFPFRTEFYPFPFTLEPLSKDSLAKYVATEMPDRLEVPPADRPIIDEIIFRATRANHFQMVNRVGPLYQRLIRLIGCLEESDFRSETADTVQAQPSPPSPTPQDPEEWPTTVDAKDPAAIDDVFIGKVRTRQDALDLLGLIARQGEGPLATPETSSHFRKFLAMYTGSASVQEFPETDPRYGPLCWQPALPVSRHPSTRPDPYQDRQRERGRITHPVALGWALLFNTRYRMLLADLAHALFINRIAGEECAARRKTLIGDAFWEMKWLTAVAGVLVTLDRQTPNLSEGGRPAKAGPPFELPYTLALPDPPAARWRLHIDLIDASAGLICDLLKNPPSDEARQVLEGLQKADKESRSTFQRYLAQPNIDCNGP